MVNKVDPCISANGKDHHTSQYDVMRRTDPHLVVRRGQPFMLNITLNRPYSRERDVVTFIFTADGKQPFIIYLMIAYYCDKKVKSL